MSITSQCSEIKLLFSAKQTQLQYNNTLSLLIYEVILKSYPLSLFPLKYGHQFPFGVKEVEEYFYIIITSHRKIDQP